MDGPVGERVERHDRARCELAVEGEIERQVHQRAAHVPEQPRIAGRPRQRDERREQLVGVQGQHRAPHAAAEVVAQERIRPEIGLALDEDVVDGVIDVDPEAARRQSGHEGPALGGDGRRGAGGDGGHEMSAGAHGLET